jgi:hypothetical protein
MAVSLMGFLTVLLGGPVLRFVLLPSGVMLTLAHGIFFSLQTDVSYFF